MKGTSLQQFPPGKIENETFNMLINLGYNFEHNYEHGKKYLYTILCFLMMPAFFNDQVQGMACNLFQSLQKKKGFYRCLWETVRVLFQYIAFESWKELYQFMAAELKLNTF
jgi:hypothetical protein